MTIRLPEPRAFEQGAAWFVLQGCGTLFGMPVIAIAGLDARCGKTTVAVALAGEWHRRKKNVILVDADPERAGESDRLTAWGWLERARDRHDPPDGLLVTSAGELWPLLREFDFAIIDCPRDEKLTRTILLESAELAILPCRDSLESARSLSKTARLVEEVGAVRGRPISARAVVTSEYAAVADGVRREAGAGGPPALTAALGPIVTCVEAFLEGLDVTRHAPDSITARRIQDLADQIEQLIAPPRPRPGDDEATDPDLGPERTELIHRPQLPQPELGVLIEGQTFRTLLEDGWRPPVTITHRVRAGEEIEELRLEVVQGAQTNPKTRKSLGGIAISTLGTEGAATEIVLTLGVSRTGALVCCARHGSNKSDLTVKVTKPRR